MLWKFGDDEGMLPAFCTPTLHDGKLYFGEGLHSDKDCRIFSIDAASGRPAWEKPFQTASHTEGAPAVSNGKIFFPAGDDGLFAADAGTGARLWQYPGGKDRGIHIDAAPAVSGNRVFAGSGLYSFVAVCLRYRHGGGEVAHRPQAPLVRRPLVLGERVYYGVGTGSMVYDAPSNTRRRADSRTARPPAWSSASMSRMARGLATIYPDRSTPGWPATPSASRDQPRQRYVHCLDRKTGKLRLEDRYRRWIYRDPGRRNGGRDADRGLRRLAGGNVVCLNPHRRGGVANQLPVFAGTATENGVFGGPVSPPPPPHRQRSSIYIGAMTVDPFNPAKKTAAIFRFDDRGRGARVICFFSYPFGAAPSMP